MRCGWGWAAVLKFYGKPLKLRRVDDDELILALANPSVKQARLSVIARRAICPSPRPQ